MEKKKRDRKEYQRIYYITHKTKLDRRDRRGSRSKLFAKYIWWFAHRTELNAKRRKGAPRKRTRAQWKAMKIKNRDRKRSLRLKKEQGYVFKPITEAVRARCEIAKRAGTIKARIRRASLLNRGVAS